MKMNVIIFAASFVLAVMYLITERAVGIPWDFHPDAVSYVNDYSLYVTGGYVPLGSAYYWLSALLSGNAGFLVAINICAYSLANTIVFSKTSAAVAESRITPLQGRLIVLAFVVCQPYRLHLAVSVLKDSLIILAFLLTFLGRFGLITGAASLLALRIPGILYFLSRVNRKPLLFLTTAAAILVLSQPEGLIDFLISRNEADMGGRSQDAVPNFSNLGAAGTILRALLWPLLALTGATMAFGGGLIFVPLSAESLATRLASLAAWRALVPRAGNIFVTLATVAAVVTTYTSFIRYAYPVLCVSIVMPILSTKKSR